MAISYGQEIRWSDLDGTTHRVEVTECASSEEAYWEVMAMAERAGWTAPKWWQWWRWQDTRPEAPEPI